MTREELIALLAERFEEDFAVTAARQVCAADAAARLYDLVVHPSPEWSREQRHRLLFRGSYVLERIYFDDCSRWVPFEEAFCRRDFAAAEDASQQRHFAKIMADLLKRKMLSAAELDPIAEAAAQWTTDPATPVAVKVWSLDILKRCRGRVAWVGESWDDLIGMLTRDASPGMVCRLRRIAAEQQ
ncbi:hypothetical protein [Alistipes sp.]|uniref:hypothetical protein n=1 Tax=Alistipes sp. TaxID=1872444 RepID=UPI0025C1F4C7|nr:hypothetical protein [Alistipes sp.]